MGKIKIQQEQVFSPYYIPKINCSYLKSKKIFYLLGLFFLNQNVMFKLNFKLKLLVW